MARRETLEFVRAYYKITDPAVRKRVFELTKAVAKAVNEVAALIMPAKDVLQERSLCEAVNNVKKQCT